ncbi:hypothetical protein JEY40_17585 [Bradyrhizobium japonicum]|uniref:AbiTii domain-containing protein n=1 Tax=Bradyrhizobium japonicum TaxID=375 RepID=UPI00200E7263|nr:hypothetical protein [Bradyrhizobium japonicum]UQD76195.1 hypothetical protein JEY40_17585 [Bradyrhizobium japonicum]
MAGLIEEIQSDAFDQNIPVSVLLRKVRAAASKLNLPPTEKWVELELSGYENGNLPDYRILFGKPKALNPYHGWIPILFDDNGLNETLARCSIAQSIASLEALLKNNDTDHLQFPIPPAIIVQINRMMGVQFGTMYVHVSHSQVHGLLDAVRNLVLDWALKLERAGIHGSGMSFNNQEKQLAKDSSTTINIGSINSMVGNLGSHNTSGDISASDISERQVKDLLAQLQPHLSDIKQAGADGARLDKAFAELSAHSAATQPKQAAIRGALTDMRNALSGAAGSLIASGATAIISKMLGL